ncbi:aminotransferase class III-fold pyridoxal phosphate-dependent enzyme [Streptococcus danieliae]|nr:aminotransferase class III-fold pyridoxal phosphate-dependent enzyme [Streptococcus danieliae]MCU0081910.1 aminotransferase class III-fold pyridoxal phosphate-dependent enzyme [Streptococcus danieliae]
MKLLRENQVITVFDEVATGFFKTGLPFFFNHLSEVPDLICLSKAINNGITPFGCVCVAEELDYRLQKSTSIKEHFSTQNGNLLGMVSAEVTLDYYLKEKSSLENRVTWISETLRNIFDAQGVIYRNIGAMISVRTIPGYAAQLVKELEKLGILVYLYANNGEEGLSIMPPLTINEVSLEKALTMIGKKVVKYQ